MKTLKKIVIGVLVYWVVFVTVSWYAFFTMGSVPDTLVQYGLGGGSAELIAAAVIEVGKHLIERKYGKEDKHNGIDLINLEDEIDG